MGEVKLIKKDFPIFDYHPDLVYLDSAAMSLKPRSVITAVDEYYRQYSANVFRGIYKLSEKATVEYEKTRRKVARFINAATEKEIIFVRNTTEAINLVAYAWGRLNIDHRDEMVTTVMEHHSNFVPWQVLAHEVGATFKIIDIDNDGYLDLGSDKLKIKNEKLKIAIQNSKLDQIITKKTKILALTYVSNVLGTIVPVKKIIRMAKKINPKIITMVDAAQAVPHLSVDVQDLGCDFLAFSGQKMLGPTGAGVLWGKKELLEEMPPFLFGGEMIREVYLKRTVFAESPHKFEAGTPHIAGVIGLGAAVDYLEGIGMDVIQKHEKELTEYALAELQQIKNLTIYGPQDTKAKSGVIIFNMKGIHPHDVAQILDENHICVRSGHHCAMPLHLRLGVPATLRATFYIYNAKEDIDKLIAALARVKKIFL
jgi:cysteine desulfurase/selenocysteine lyase